MRKILFVGGTFDDNGGRPSSIVRKFSEIIQSKYNFYKVDLYNGGFFSDIENIVELAIYYDYVFWWPNIPNEKPKLRNIKDINQKCILITSKRNDGDKYSFAGLINHALGVKANLCIEFSYIEQAYRMRLFDPLGNLWYEGNEISDIIKILINRMVFLSNISRQNCVQINKQIVIPDEQDFFDIVKRYGDTFYELIQPDREVTRYLGNASFRCQRGFPSFRKNGQVFVSKRNVDKRYIDRDAFVPVGIDDNILWYSGDHKPSVDTPIQIRLYNQLPNINYMLHAHVYIKNAPYTNHNIPCGGIEEVDEILKTIGYNYNKDFYAINLIGHGCIVMANNVDQLKNLDYISRKMPEKI